MADPEHDDDFEAYLKRRVPIDQRMKTVDRLEPPPELDRVIIGKARNAIQNSSHVPMYRAPKWALPVGLAATLLIAFAIVLDLGIRSDRRQTERAPAVAAATSSESVAAPAPAAPTVPSVNAPQESAPTGSAASAGASDGVASAKTFARMRPPPIQTAPWPPLPRTAAKPAAPSDAASSEYATTESKAEFDPRSRSAERRVAEKRMRTDDSARLAAAAADVSSPPAPNAAPDIATAAPAPRVASSAAPAVPTPAAPPPRPLVDATANAEPPAPMRLAASSPRASAVTFDGTKVIESHSVERLDSASGGIAAQAAAPALAPAAAAAADRREHPDPKAWLDQIQKMRVAGLTARAEQELKHFRDAYPAYPTASTDSGAQ
jgi:hypothetical protein